MGEWEVYNYKDEKWEPFDEQIMPNNDFAMLEDWLNKTCYQYDLIPDSAYDKIISNFEKALKEKYNYNIPSLRIRSINNHLRTLGPEYPIYYAMFYSKEYSETLLENAYEVLYNEYNNFRETVYSIISMNFYIN